MKRRKVWWIVCGVLGFVALIFVTAFLIEWNSPDAELDRTLKKIIAENGFVYSADLTEEVVAEWHPGDAVAVYEGAPISQENTMRIIAQLCEACPECTVNSTTESLERSGFDSDSIQYGMDPSGRSYWLTGEDSNISIIRIDFAAEGLGLEGDHEASQLEIYRTHFPGRWSFLKNLWPW